MAGKNLFFFDGELKNRPRLQCDIGAIIKVEEELFAFSRVIVSVAIENGSISAQKT